MALCSTSVPSLRRCTMIFLTLSTFLLASFALPLHSDDDSITQVTCAPADFRSLLLFFFANYAVHAATVPSVAGRPAVSVLWIIGSFFYPFLGLIRSITLLSHYALSKDEIGRAISQGAVMVAARSSDWVPRFTHNELIYVGLLREFPENTDEAELPKARFHTIPDIYTSMDDSPSDAAVETNYVTLNGETSLPKGYFWSKPEITQQNALACHTSEREDIRVGRSRNVVKGLASVAQLIFSSITLYRTRGPQIQQYGYAAFGLSVFPYALMSFVNLVVVTIVGEYSTVFVLRTAISEEAKRCGGKISGEIGTLLKESPVEEGRSLKMGNDGEDRHVMPLLKVDDSNDEGPELLEKGGDLLGEANKTTTTGTPPETKSMIGTVYDLVSANIQKGSVGTGGEGKDASGVPMPEDQEDPAAVFLTGKPLIAANIRVEDDGVLVITMKGRTGRFKLIEGDDASGDEVIDDSDDPLTFHFYVSSLTNQEKISKREEPPEAVAMVYQLFNLILIILPYIFIFLLTGFRNGNSTSAERGWMMSWLVFNQIFSAIGYLFSLADIANLAQASFLAIFVIVYSAPAIGGFVMVGKMFLQFGTCSISY